MIQITPRLVIARQADLHPSRSEQVVTDGYVSVGPGERDSESVTGPLALSDLECPTQRRD